MNVGRKTTFIAREMVLFAKEVVLVDTISFRHGVDLKCGYFMEVNVDLLRICESDNFFVDYDIGRGMYRLSTFDPNADYPDSCYVKERYWFDAYEEKELDKSFPQTIGDITFYSKAELFEWVENQQQINKLSFLSVTIPDEDIDKINSIRRENLISYSDLAKVIKGHEDVIGDTIEKLSQEEFYEQYCCNCGSQRCEGIGTEWFDGCQFKDHLNT